MSHVTILVASLPLQLLNDPGLQYKQWATPEHGVPG